jgi:hypothetical protein
MAHYHSSHIGVPIFILEAPVFRQQLLSCLLDLKAPIYSLCFSITIVNHIKHMHFSAIGNGITNKAHTLAFIELKRSP